MAIQTQTKTTLVLVLSSLLLAGCLGNNVRPDAKQGYVSVGRVNHSDMASVQAQIEDLLVGEGIQTATQRRVAWSRLLRSYESSDGRFELAVLTAMAMDQLAADQRHAFLRTAAQIRDRVDEDTGLAPETEAVLALADALGKPGDPPYNPHRDKGRVTHAVENLLADD
jgi:hypothetical protein